MSEETILQGAEPFFFKGNHIGVLVCHGFTGTTQSMRYLGEQLHGAGFTVIGPRLKGHGISPAAMAKTTAQDWIDSVDEALVELAVRRRSGDGRPWFALLQAADWSSDGAMTPEHGRR